MDKLNRSIICIDLKSFFASCECIEKNLNPFTFPLVVANPKQGKGALTLAVTPYLKTLGVKSRGRLYEIPKNIKYYITKPQMSLYMKKSKEVTDIYLDFVAAEDLYVYSIDECFLDVTNYLKLYNKTDYELALDILNKVKEKTKLTAVVGIGPNMLIAKVAMDVEAKHNKDCIAKWDYKDIPLKLWNISPLSKMWGIGPRMEKKLNQMKLYSIGDIAKMDKMVLKQRFGTIGEDIWNHANGINTTLLKDLNNYKVKEQSYSHSQVLFKDYNDKNIGIIINEMVEMLTARLRHNNKECIGVGLGIDYSKNVGGSFYHQIKLEIPTDDNKEIIKVCNLIFDRFYENLPIRKITISLNGLIPKVGKQLNLFEEAKTTKKEESINKVIDKIKSKYGKNSLLKASNLLKDSTAIERNKKIKGHDE